MSNSIFDSNTASFARVQSTSLGEAGLPSAALVHDQVSPAHGQSSAQNMASSGGLMTHPGMSNSGPELDQPARRHHSVTHGTIEHLDPTDLTRLASRNSQYFDNPQASRIDNPYDFNHLRPAPETRLPPSSGYEDRQMIQDTNVPFVNQTSEFAPFTKPSMNKFSESMPNQFTQIADDSITSCNVNVLQAPMHSTGLEPYAIGTDSTNLHRRRGVRGDCMSPQLYPNTHAAALPPRPPVANRQSILVHTENRTPQIVHFSRNLPRQPPTGPAFNSNHTIHYTMPFQSPGTDQNEPHAAPQDRYMSNSTDASNSLTGVPLPAPRNSTALSQSNVQNYQEASRLQQLQQYQPQTLMQQNQSQIPQAQVMMPQELPSQVTHSQIPFAGNPCHSLPAVTTLPPQTMTQTHRLTNCGTTGPAGTISAPNDHSSETNIVDPLAQTLARSSELQLTMHRENLAFHREQAEYNRADRQRTMSFFANATQNIHQATVNDTNPGTLPRQKVLSNIQKCKPPKFSFERSDSLVKVLLNFELYSQSFSMNHAELRVALRSVFRKKGACGQKEAEQVIDESGQDLTEHRGRMAIYRRLVRYFQPDHQYSYSRKKDFESFYNAYMHIKTILSFDEFEGECDSVTLRRRAWKTLTDTNNCIISHKEKQFLRCRSLEADLATLIASETNMKKFLGTAENIWRIQTESYPDPKISSTNYGINAVTTTQFTNGTASAKSTSKEPTTFEADSDETEKNSTVEDSTSGSSKN